MQGSSVTFGSEPWFEPELSRTRPYTFILVVCISALELQSLTASSAVSPEQLIHLAIHHQNLPAYRLSSPESLPPPPQPIFHERKPLVWRSAEFRVLLEARQCLGEGYRKEDMGVSGYLDDGLVSRKGEWGLCEFMLLSSLRI